ncbi:MAG TPA: LLM class flavin-dependent oxidoreductase, partial [Ureibacillus sp.]|nr:LLM class flavin-dependent oxidoreductase [Ureibacillus sp.]
FDAAALPVGTTSFFFAAETTQEAMRAMYPYINEGMKLTNGQGFPKQAFAHAADEHSVINVGSPQEIIEKILYQHEIYGHQRYLAQMDFGGVPFDSLMKNVEIIGNEILPAIRKYTAKK